MHTFNFSIHLCTRTVWSFYKKKRKKKSGGKGNPIPLLGERKQKVTNMAFKSWIWKYCQTRRYKVASLFHLVIFYSVEGVVLCPKMSCPQISCSLLLYIIDFIKRGHRRITVIKTKGVKLERKKKEEKRVLK